MAKVAKQLRKARGYVGFVPEGSEVKAWQQEQELLGSAVRKEQRDGA